MSYYDDDDSFPPPQQISDGQGGFITPESPYEKALREGGQSAADALLQAGNQYYAGSGDPNAVQTGPGTFTNGTINIAEHPAVDWTDPASYNYLINTPGSGPTDTPPPGSNSGEYPGLPNPADYPAVPLPQAVPPPDPLAPWTETFSAPTPEQAASEPGFQFQLGEGLKALERSAAAKGTLLTGGTVKGLERYATDFANTNYQNVYDRAYNEYEGRRTNFLQNEANRYNSQYQNWAGQFGQNQTLFGDQFNNNAQQFGINSDYFNMGQAQRLNDFNIWNTTDMNSFSKLLQLAQLTKPPSPYMLTY